MRCPGGPLEPFSREPFLFLFPPLDCKLHCSLEAVFFLFFPEENIFHQQQSWFLGCSTEAAELKTRHSICQGDFSQLKKRKTNLFVKKNICFEGFAKGNGLEKTFGSGAEVLPGLWPVLPPVMESGRYRGTRPSGLGVKCDPGVGAPGPGVTLPRLLSRSQVHRAGGREDRAVPRPEPPADVQCPLHCDPGQHEEGEPGAKPGPAARRPPSSPAPLQATVGTPTAS